MTIQPSEFWVAEIPFTDGTAAKKRPVLVLWLDARDAIVAAVTSAQPRTQTDVTLNDWAASGLRAASTVRLSRLDCLEVMLFLGRVGRISDADAVTVRTTWDQLIKPQF